MEFQQKRQNLKGIKTMSIRILVIDDMPEARILMEEFLKDEGYEVITAQDGEEALMLMEISPVSLVISDIMMPKMGGFEFIEKCRKLDPFNHIPIIVVSAKSAASTERLTLELGGNGFLEKPINLDVLSKIIESTLASALNRMKRIDQDKKAQDRRQYRRVPFFCEAHFYSEAFSGLTAITSLSQGGCNLEIHASVPVGSLMYIKLKVQPGYTIEVLGEVCYSIAKSSVGVRFLNLDRDDAKLIEAIVCNIADADRIFELEYCSQPHKLLNSVDSAVNFSNTQQLPTSEAISHLG
jgi:CheY-like chemotaxis protein